MLYGCADLGRDRGGWSSSNIRAKLVGDNLIRDFLVVHRPLSGLEHGINRFAPG
jgi:hypothetical protein